MSPSPYRENQRREPPPPHKGKGRRPALTLTRYVNVVSVALIGALCLNVSVANLACLACWAFAGLFALSAFPGVKP